MHPIATLDVTVSGKFDFAKANVIIQTTANNQAIHINLAKAFPVDPQQHLYYFYVQVPGGKEYLIAFRVSVNNQLTERQFSCTLESGQIPWPTQGIQPSYNNPYGGGNDPYGNMNNPYSSSSNDPYGNTGNTNNPYGSSLNNPYGGTTSNPTGSQNNPYGNTTGNSGNTSSTGSVNDPYDGTTAWD